MRKSVVHQACLTSTRTCQQDTASPWVRTARTLEKSHYIYNHVSFYWHISSFWGSEQEGCPSSALPTHTPETGVQKLGRRAQKRPREQYAGRTAALRGCTEIKCFYSPGAHQDLWRCAGRDAADSCTNRLWEFTQATRFEGHLQSRLTDQPLTAQPTQGSISQDTSRSLRS